MVCNPCWALPRQVCTPPPTRKTLESAHRTPCGGKRSFAVHWRYLRCTVSSSQGLRGGNPCQVLSSTPCLRSEPRQAKGCSPHRLLPAACFFLTDLNSMHVALCAIVINASPAIGSWPSAAEAPTIRALRRNWTACEAADGDAAGVPARVGDALGLRTHASARKSKFSH